LSRSAGAENAAIAFGIRPLGRQACDVLDVNGNPTQSRLRTVAA